MSSSKRMVFLIYGIVSYAAFFGIFVYMIGFLTNLVVPKSIDGPVGDGGSGVLINVVLLGLFAIQHSTMARPGFKAKWTKIVPEPIERSTYVLITSVLLIVMVLQWRPMTETIIWQVDASAIRAILHGLSVLGFGIVLYSSCLIDHFDLFGLRQVVLCFRGQPYTSPVFRTRGLYRFIRHPLLAGFMIAFWSAPTMTAGHLLFAVATTVYMFIGLTLEERDLLNVLGEDYKQYRARTPMFLPLGKKG